MPSNVPVTCDLGCCSVFRNKLNGNFLFRSQQFSSFSLHRSNLVVHLVSKLIALLIHSPNPKASSFPTNYMITMLGVRSSRLSRKSADSLAYKEKKQKNVFFYAANSDSYNLSPTSTSTTSCETSLESSTYMEEDQPFDCIELSPDIESTSSDQSTKLVKEDVLKSSKYCGSAYIKARKHRREMIKKSLKQYSDPPLDHLLLVGTKVEGSPSSFQSKLMKEATLIIKRRNSESDVRIPSDEAESPPLPLSSTLTAPSTWPQSNWRTGTVNINSTEEHLENSSSRPSISIRESLINSIKAESLNVTPVSTNNEAQDDAFDIVKARREKHINKVKEMARNRKERSEKTKEQNSEQPKTKTSQHLKDFVDHLLTINATNQICRKPSSFSAKEKKDSKKRVTFKGDPTLPKPILRRRSNSPVNQDLPKPVLKRVTQRFSSGPITCAPFDDEVLSPADGWKSVFLCGSERKMYRP